MYSQIRFFSMFPLVVIAIFPVFIRGKLGFVTNDIVFYLTDNFGT